MNCVVQYATGGCTGTHTATILSEICDLAADMVKTARFIELEAPNLKSLQLAAETARLALERLEFSASFWLDAKNEDVEW